MASKVSGIIEQIKAYGSSGTAYAIASTAYGYCETAASTQIKNVDMTGFKLNEGVTVHIKFANANSAANPKLKFNGEADTNAKPIVQYGTTAAGTTSETDGWSAGAVLTLTYDGTSWVRDQGFNTNTDAKVEQNSNTDDKEYPIILKNTNNTTNETAGVKYTGDITINPNKATLTATNLKGKLTTTRITQPALTGTGTTATDAGASNASTRYRPAIWTFNANITPTDGDIITIKQPCVGHDYGTWLTMDNGSTYYPVVYANGSRITTHFSNGVSIKLYFDASGTASVFPLGGSSSRSTITGVWRVLTMYDSNSNDTGYYHRRIYPNLKAGGAIHPYSIIMQLPNGKWSGITTTAPNNPGKSNVSPVATGKAASTSGYMLGHVLLMYSNTTYADTNNIGTYNIWSAHTGLIDARYSFDLANSTGNGFVAYTPVYIVGTISNGLFYLDTTKWWTQTLPSSDDEKVYIYIGDAYDWYRLTFTEDKPIYWYKDGAVRLYDGGRAINTITRSGTTFTATRDDGSTFTFTQRDNNTTYTFADGTNGFTVTPSGGTAQTVTVTPSITNNITGTGTANYLTKFTGTNTIGSTGIAIDSSNNITLPSSIIKFTGLGEGMELTNNNDYFGTNYDARILSIIDSNPGAGSTAVDGGFIIQAVGRISGTDTIQELLRIRNHNGSSSWKTGEFQWKTQDIVVEVGKANKTWDISIAGDAATVNGLTVKTAVPANAVFTDTNKYHKTGSWNGLTYTATAVNSADELKFTIPTGTSATTVAVGNHTHSTYLPKSGGTMDGTARITWADSGSWGTEGATFPNKRGGLYWTGTSDWIDLFAEETASDKLNLVINFGDDASPSLILRDRGTDKITLTPGSGAIVATSFSGSGALLTSLNASNLDSGTVPVDRLPIATSEALGIVQTGTGITNTNGVISVTAENLGLSKAMRFIGVAVNGITDGGTEDPGISNYTTKTAGDVIIDKDTRREYVWSTTNKWEMLGFDASTIYSKTTSGNTFISSISQATDGTVAAESRALDTSGTWSGNASTATTATYLSNIGRQTNTDIDFGTTTYNSKVFISYADGSTTTHKPPSNAMIFNVAWDNINSNHYGGQIAMSNSNNTTLYLRGCNNGEWDSNWKTVLDSSNYTTYAVAKTAGVTAVTWDATNKKLTRTINGTAADVMTAAQMSTALGLGTIASKAATDYLPVKYSNLDYTSTATSMGVYPISGQTHPVTGKTEYGGAIQFGGNSTSNNYYAAQLLISSESGGTSPVHAYIRRMTSTPGWSNWITLLDSNNTTTGTNNTETLTWNTTYTIAKINGTDIKFTTMARPTPADISALALDGSNNMTSDINIIAGDTDKFINFWYNTNKKAGASWRTGMLGSGSSNTNYFVIESGTSTTSNTEWKRVLQIGQNTYNAGFGGNIYPINTNTKTLGTSENLWANVYATTFTGDLTGNADTADAAKWLMSRGTNVTIADSTWAHGQVGRGGTNTANGIVWKQKWTQSGLKYNTSANLTDSGDIILWLSQSTNANALWINMAIDGYIYSHSGFKTLTQDAAYSEGIRFVNSSATEKASINSDNNGVLGLYGSNKVVLRPQINASTKGLEVQSTVVIPTQNNVMSLGDSTHKWTTVYAATFDGNATSSSTIAATLNQASKAYLLGTTTTLSGTEANVSVIGDSYVYLTNTAGGFSAVRHYYNVSGTDKAYTTYNDTDQSIEFIFA